MGVLSVLRFVIFAAVLIYYLRPPGFLQQSPVAVGILKCACFGEADPFSPEDGLEQQ